VFNGNFTRERYGRAAVQDPVALDADRRSLLLDSNQTNEQKATSMVSALEFDNGLAAVQNMSDADVAATVSPANIDQFKRRPESMYLNAAELSGPKRDTLMPAFRGQAEPEFVDAMISRVGGDPTNFATFGDVVADQTIMQSIAADSISASMLSSHPNGAPEMAASQTAMQEVAASQTAMEEVAATQTAMQEVANSLTAIDEVVISQTAMQEVAASQTAMQEVAASQTAMEEVAGSQPARDAVASSGTAVSVIEAASSSVLDSTPSTNNAPLYIAELSGAGGGGAQDFEGDFNGGDGSDTTFHESVAEGGAGGNANLGGSAPDGSGFAGTQDVVIDSITGGGGAGGAGKSAQSGGDGGFVKALIINTERDSLSLVIGTGGPRGNRRADNGTDGSTTIFTPNVF
jgi:hypothetical protein